MDLCSVPAFVFIQLLFILVLWSSMINDRVTIINDGVDVSASALASFLHSLDSID